MARPARVVEHLRLRGESESAVRHALPALEDAFRTASLPGAGARLICVRRLQLGPLAANASAQSVSLLIEKRFAEDDWTIVHAVERGADDAQAVWFRDAFEAHEAAALKVAAGQPLDDWFWPLAVPAITAAASDERLRTIALAIASMDEAPVALPAWTTALVRAGYRSQLIAALRPGDGHALLRAAGVTSLPSEAARSASLSRHATRDRGQADGIADDRAEFVELIAGRAVERAPQFPRPLPQRATEAGQAPDASAPDVDARASRGWGGDPQGAGQVERISRPQDDPADSEFIQRGEPARNSAHDEPVEAAGAGSVYERQELRSSSRSNAPSPQRAAAGGHSERAPIEDERERAADAPHAFTSPWRFPYAAPTAAGGLLFLLPVLERVGFAAWAAGRGPDEPQPDVLAAQILHLLLSRLRVDEEDPAWALAAAFRLKPEATQTPKSALKPDPPTEPRGFRPQPEDPEDLRGFRLQPEDPEGLRGFRLQPEDPEGLRGFRLQPEGCELAGTWLTTCRRYLRRRARIGLASLVVRPARVAITPTHVDLFFRLNAADMRVRRVGLDIDPGWVPWFGRVVGFHYEDRPWN